jgi:hypothetical protein
VAALQLPRAGCSGFPHVPPEHVKTSPAKGVGPETICGNRSQPHHDARHGFGKPAAICFLDRSQALVGVLVCLHKTVLMFSNRARDKAATFPREKTSIFWHRIVALEEIFESSQLGPLRMERLLPQALKPMTPTTSPSKNGMGQSYVFSVSVVISSAIVAPASTLPLIGGTSASYVVVIEVPRHCED